MKAFGLTVEYNPFHFGHEYLLNKIKNDNPDAVIITVMSGDFVQRGEAAVFDKFTRAAAACRCGADLVLELPVRWSISGAEAFAFGAVSILAGVGVKNICFGSESGEIQALAAAAEVLLDASLENEINQIIKNDKSVSYAAARSTALSSRLGKDIEFFKQPNNILGIEYIKAARKLNYEIEFHTIPRVGNNHDTVGDGLVLSASDIRGRFFNTGAIEQYVPKAAAPVYTTAINCGKYLSREKYNSALLTALSLSNPDNIAKGAFCGRELANTLYSALKYSGTYDELIDNSSSKTYTKAHVRRAVLSGVLQIESNNVVKPGFARILASNEKGRQYLKDMRASTDIPVISKTADIKKTAAENIAVFEECARANDLYNLVCVNAKNDFHSDWKRGPALL